jgi:hypothetical protein
MKTLNPTWRPMSISLQALCNGDRDRKLRFSCYDWDSDGSNDLIGIAYTTLNELAQTGPGKELDLINAKKMPGGKKAKKHYKNSGVLSLLSVQIEEDKGFVEYLRNGLELNVSIGIDFTGSNGAPSAPTSLHYMDPYRPNQYATAITAVGAVIQDYDADKLFPSFGFGAKLPDNSVSHCFSLTGDQQNPYCAGVEGIVAMYQQTIPRVQLWGPTNFEPIIKQTEAFAAAAHGTGAVRGFLTEKLHSRMPLSFTPLLRLKRCLACDQWHSSRLFTPLTGWLC